MFTKKKTQLDRETAQNLIEANTEVQGNIAFSGGIQIRGKIIGDIKARDKPSPDSKSKAAANTIHVCQGGLVEGDLFAESILVDGTVLGDIFCSQDLTLGEHARVNGTINYKRISVNSGAEVRGNFNAETTLHSLPVLEEQKQSEKKIKPEAKK